MQGVDGVEQGRLVGGIETEEKPYEAGKAEGQEDGQRGNGFNLTDSGIVPVPPLFCPLTNRMAVVQLSPIQLLGS